MSNQYKNQNNGIKKGFSKTQQKFVPKGEQSNYNPTVSNSYRESISRQSGLAPEEDVGMSKINMKAEEGNRVSNNTQPGGKFVNYLPQDEAVAVGRGFEEGALDPEESQRVVDLLNRELGRLLKLKARHFWKEVAGDSSLHAFIESFLKYRGRWYDFTYREAKGTVAGVIIGEFELCRRVFMLLYRISSNRDPGAKSVDSLSPKDHAALLQEKKFLDLPKLLDICAIYGHENKDMIRLLITNSIKAQPWMHDEFLAFLSHVLSIIHTMSQRCSSSLEVLMPSVKLQDQLTNQSHSDYLEVMDFINDAVVTIDAFIDAYNPAAIFLSCPVEMSYGNEELLITLARLHDSLLPSLRDGLRLILGLEDRGVDLVLETFTSLKLLSMRIVKLGWRLIYLCYLSDEAFENNCPFPSSMKMFPATVDDVVIRADILLQTLRDISQIHTDSIVGPGKDGSFLQNMEKDHNILSRIGLLQNTGWMSLDDQQYQFLSNILSYYHPLEVNKTEVPKLSSSDVRTGKNIQADEDTVILESKISQIKDLFPDYGKGYLAACLEAYDHNPEEVIQRILEQNLHEDLQALDISMEDLPERKTSKSYDKGKGKQPESEPSISSSVTSKSHDKGKGKQPESEPSNSSSVGRYTRKTDNDFMQSQVLDSRDKEYMLKNSALISSQLEYEDEYDDSFDELGLGVVDSGYDEPEATEASEADNGRSNSSTNSKWGSRKTPQYYVKDGKNYSYKVEGGVAVANYKEATLVNESQKETIHGLGRGGNIPLGALKKMAEASKISEETELSEHGQGHGGGGRGNFRGRGRRGGGGRNAHNIDVNQSPPGGSNNNGNDEGDANEGEGGGGQGNFRGRGRRGGGGGRSHYRKDQAMKKHLSSLRG